MILNVSGRTDIVAFYSKWFMKRYKEGYFDVRNPFNPKLVSRININDVDGIVGDIIEDDGTLTNIEIVESVGCTEDEYTSYTIIEISKNCKFEKRKIKYDREKFVNKILNIDFPDKNNILKYFYRIDNL